MPLFSTIDLVALAWFIGAWAIYSVTRAMTEKRRRPQFGDEPLPRRLDVPDAGARHADGRRPDRGRAAERHGVLRLDLADRHRRRADVVALLRRDPRRGRGP